MLILSLTLMSMFILMYCIYVSFCKLLFYGDFIPKPQYTMKDLIASCCMIGEQLQRHCICIFQMKIPCKCSFLSHEVALKND
jgi:hypothetical protein